MSSHDALRIRIEDVIGGRDVAPPTRQRSTGTRAPSRSRTTRAGGVVAFLAILACGGGLELTHVAVIAQPCAPAETCEGSDRACNCESSRLLDALANAVYLGPGGWQRLIDDVVVDELVLAPPDAAARHPIADELGVAHDAFDAMIAGVLITRRDLDCGSDDTAFTLAPIASLRIGADDAFCAEDLASLGQWRAPWPTKLTCTATLVRDGGRTLAVTAQHCVPACNPGEPWGNVRFFAGFESSRVDASGTWTPSAAYRPTGRYLCGPDVYRGDGVAVVEIERYFAADSDAPVDPGIALSKREPSVAASLQHRLGLPLQVHTRTIATEADRTDAGLFRAGYANAWGSSGSPLFAIGTTSPEIVGVQLNNHDVWAAKGSCGACSCFLRPSPTNKATGIAPLAAIDLERGPWTDYACEIKQRE